MNQQHRLTINERYRLALASGAEQRSATSSLENPSSWFVDWIHGGYSASGIAVNDESALRLAAVYACNRVLSESIASLPVALFRDTPDGAQSAANRPEHRLISSQPSSLYTSYTFRSTGQFHLGMRGNFYARIRRDGRGGARELRILHPNCVRAFFYEDKLYYEVSPNPATGNSGPREILTPDDILHVAAMSMDGINGRSPISVLRDTLGIGLGNVDYMGKVQKRGGRLEGFLYHPNKLNPDQVANMRLNFTGAMQRGDLPVLENGLEYKSVSLNPQDAEFINTHKLTTTDIARAYRVPPHMIGDLERATFSNIEHQGLEFVTNTLLPWIKNWEAELNRKLLPQEIQDSHYFRFNVEGLLRGDIRTRFEAYTKAIQWGILNRDEVRALENRNKIPGGLGEEFLTPLNMAILGDEPEPGDPNTDDNTDDNQTPQQNGQGAGK